MLKEDLSIDTTFNPHKFSSDSTFNLTGGEFWDLVDLNRPNLTSAEKKKSTFLNSSILLKKSLRIISC